jgi:hypothetical protein
LQELVRPRRPPVADSHRVVRQELIRISIIWLRPCGTIDLLVYDTHFVDDLREHLSDVALPDFSRLPR